MDVLADIFNGSTTEEEICDHIRTEWLLCQMEEISESFYKKDVDKSSGRKQDSYWEKAFELLEVPNVAANDNDCVDIEYFVNNLAAITVVDGKQNIPIWFSIYKCILSLIA